MREGVRVRMRVRVCVCVRPIYNIGKPGLVVTETTHFKVADGFLSR